MRIRRLWAFHLCLVGSLVSAGDDVRPRAPRVIEPQQSDFFESRVRPVFAAHCFACHGPKKQQAGLRLDSREGLLKGADSGPVVVPGQPEESPLIEAIRHDATVKMPPRSKLPEAGHRRPDDLGPNRRSLARAPTRHRRRPQPNERVRIPRTARPQRATGPSSRSRTRLSRLPGIPCGPSRRSIASSWRDWKEGAQARLSG